MTFYGALETAGERDSAKKVKSIEEFGSLSSMSWCKCTERKERECI